MKKLFISAAIVTGLIFVGAATSFANDTGMKQTEMRENAKGITLISGQITDIKGDSLTVKDQNGNTHKVIPAEPSELAKVKVGDTITAKIRDGRAVAIDKTDATGNSETMQGGSQNQGSDTKGSESQGSNY